MAVDPAAEPPSPWIVRFAALVPAGGEVLDVACGGGRHARLFLARGHRVLCLDREVSAVGDLGGDPRVEIVAADLEDGSPWPLGERTFAGIVVVNYLHRPILPRLVEALQTGGVLLYETFAQGNERFAKPRNPDHLLHEGELRGLAHGRLREIAYEHGIVDTGSGPRVKQRLCAVKKAVAGAVGR